MQLCNSSIPLSALHLSCSTLYLICICCFLSVQLAAAFDGGIENLQSMSSRSGKSLAGNGEGPARKKSRMDRPSPLERFPTTLEDFQYHFNEKGQLRHAVSGEPYEFVVQKGNPAYNQKRYEALGKVITQHIYSLLENDAELKRLYIPIDATGDEPRGFVFASENALTTSDKLLVLINGAGAVRAGQWARRLIINDCLDSGTQLPFIKRGLQEGYEVLVMNTNENRALDAQANSLPIRRSGNPFEHAEYVWDKFVSNSPAQKVAIIAHSMGGSVTAHLARKKERSFLKKVFAIAFTDSIHNLGLSDTPQRIRKFFAEHSVNWVSSAKPLDTPIPARSLRADSKLVSSGTKVHAETSWSSYRSIFLFLTDQERAMSNGEKQTPPIATDEDFEEEEEDDESTLELRTEPDGEDNDEDGDGGGGGDAKKGGAKPLNARSAGIEISSSDEDTEASFDFTRYSEEL